MEKIPLLHFGPENKIKSASELLEELLAFKAEIASQSERAVAEAERGTSTYIPFPFGLDPGQLAELLYVDATHRACCVLKARAILASEWRVVRRDGRVEEPPEALIRRIHEVFPDGLDEVIYPAALDYEAVGNAYLEVIRKPDARYPPGLGPVARVVHVPAFSVRRLPPDHPSGCAYVQIYRGEEVYFREFGQPEPVRLKDQGPVTEILHIRNLGGLSRNNYWYGIPDIVAALPALYGYRKAQEFLNAHLAARGVPNYLLILTGAGTSPDALDYPTINRYYNEALEKGPGRIVIIPTPPSVEAQLQPLSLGYNPRDVIEYMHECRDTIARVHGIPLRLLSILEAGQLGSTGEAQAQLEFFKRYVVRPRQLLWANVLNRLIFQQNESWKDWTIEFGEVTLEDALRIAQADAFAVRFGFMTPNEARIKRGLAPVPGGDEIILLAGGEPIRLRDVVGATPEEEAEALEEAEAKASRPGLRIQSLLFDKEVFPSEESALRWAEEHGFMGVLVDSPGRYWRVRVMDPATCTRRSFRIIDLRPGVRAIVCRPMVPLKPKSSVC